MLKLIHEVCVEHTGRMRRTGAIAAAFALRRHAPRSLGGARLGGYRLYGW